MKSKPTRRDKQPTPPIIETVIETKPSLPIRWFAQIYLCFSLIISTVYIILTYALPIRARMPAYRELGVPAKPRHRRDSVTSTDAIEPVPRRLARTYGFGIKIVHQPIVQDSFSTEFFPGGPEDQPPLRGGSVVFRNPFPCKVPHSLPTNSTHNTFATNNTADTPVLVDVPMIPKITCTVPTEDLEEDACAILHDLVAIDTLEGSRLEERTDSMDPFEAACRSEESLASTLLDHSFACKMIITEAPTSFSEYNLEDKKTTAIPDSGAQLTLSSLLHPSTFASTEMDPSLDPNASKLSKVAGECASGVVHDCAGW